MTTTSGPPVPPVWREVARRVAIWAFVAAYLVCAVWGFALVVSNGWILLGWTGFPIVGGLVLTSRPGNGVGRLLVASGLMWALSGIAVALVTVGHLPPAAAVLVEMAGNVTWMLAFGALVLLTAVFPTGRPETAVGRVVVRALVVVALLSAAAALLDPRPQEATGLISPFAAPALRAVVVPWVDHSDVLSQLLVVAALVDVVARWRRGGAAVRLQFRWFAFGVGVVVLVFGLSPMIPEGSAFQYLYAVLNLIPVSIGIAVTRHGLYEINRVVSRTVSYVVVTALVVGVYALVVTSVSRLAPESSSAGAAVATLAAAGVFLPVLRRVQRVVDRRFDRERVDAARVVDEFGARLRSGADPGRTTSDLLAAVERSVQPAGVGLWTVRSES